MQLIKTMLILMLLMMALSEVAYSSNSPDQAALQQAHELLHQGEIQASLQIYKEMALRKNKVACWWLGSYYYSGSYVRLDYKQAKRYLTCAAQQGIAGAQSDLGLMYKEGRGVKKSYKKASYWFEQAVKKGDMTAQYNLANLYYFGYGVKVNIKKALALYKASALKGNVFSELLLGYFHWLGEEGIPINKLDSYVWLRMAMLNGSLEGKRAVERLSKQLTDQQLKMGNALSKQYWSKEEKDQLVSYQYSS